MRLVVPLLALALAGCTRSDADKPIWVGHVHGTNHGDDEYRAVRLAVEELNKEPGRLPQGRRLEVRHAPGGNKTEEWGAQAVRLVSLNRVNGLVAGGGGPEAERVGAAALDGSVVGISTAGWPGASSQNLFAVGLAPAERGRVLADMVKMRGAKSVRVLRDPAARAANLAADRFVADLRAAGVVVTEVEVSTPPKGGAEPVVFFACPARQAADHRPAMNKDAMLLFGDDDAELPALLAAGTADGFHIATAYYSGATSDRLTAFAAKYQEAYKQPPTTAAVLAYDALTIWAEAARRANGTDPAAVRGELLKREQPFDGLTGPLAFAADHTARRPAFVCRVTGGALELVRRYDAEPAK